MTKLLILLINFYQTYLEKIFFVVFNNKCRFNPSCSDYSKKALEKYGFFKGIKLTFLRLIRCQPFSKSSSLDPVP